MEKPRLRRTLLAVPGLTYRAKALALATLAAGVPFALTVGMTLHPPLFGATPFMATAAAAMVSLLLLLALSSLLSAVNEAASELRAAADVAGLQTGAPRSDEVARMMADTKAVTERLESVRHRLANRHPVTGVDTREPFLETIARDVSGEKRSPAVLGVLRMAQFDRLASVNKAAADRALAAFAKRLTDVLGGVRPLAQVDRDC
jgi:GGDEF domain-containing protein